MHDPTGEHLLPKPLLALVEINQGNSWIYEFLFYLIPSDIPITLLRKLAYYYFTHLNILTKVMYIILVC